MYQKVKVIVCMAMFMISGFGLSAQTDTIVSNISNVQEVQHGEIVMTKSELISFLEKIAEARKQKVEFDLTGRRIILSFFKKSIKLSIFKRYNSDSSFSSI